MADRSGLTWALKESLIAYVEGLDDGNAEALAPAVRSGAAFTFPWDGASPERSAGALVGTLQFLGAVRLTGHWGMLDVELREPRIELREGSGTLLFRQRGGLDPDKFLPFADLAVCQEADSAGGCVERAMTESIELSASLTGQGRLLLGGQYNVGEALSPLRLTFPQHDD